MLEAQLRGKLTRREEEVGLTESREIKEAAEKVAGEKLEARSWSWLGEDGRRIEKILESVDGDDRMGALEAWKHHLEENLTFPFDAEVSEYQEKGQLRTGDKVSVKKISLSDDFHGIIVELRRGRKKYYFPLCDLEVVNKDSINHQHVKNYCVWFANR